MRSENFIVARSTIRVSFYNSRLIVCQRFTAALMVAQKYRDHHVRFLRRSPRRPNDCESFRQRRLALFRSESGGTIHESSFRRDAASTSLRPGFTSTRDASYLTDPDTPGLGGGVGRGLGVVWGLAVGLGLGVGVALPEGEAVAVGVGVTIGVAVAVAVAVAVGVALTVAVAVAVGVAVEVAVAVGVGVGVPPPGTRKA